jgi:hypothetical protein
MAIAYSGAPEELQAFANQINGRSGEMNKNIADLAGLQQGFGAAVRESQTAAAIQGAFGNAQTAANNLLRALMEAEGAMRGAGAKVASADSEGQSQINSAGYNF